MPDLPDLNAPKFAPLKARLACAYLDHKADVGAPHATDEAIIDRTDEITALMFDAMAKGPSDATLGCCTTVGSST